MKKILCLVLAAVMVCAMFAASAETVTEESVFDKSKLTGSSLYNYDKFTKEWNIQGTYVKEYSDARIRVALILFDAYVEQQDGPEMRIDFLDKDNQSYLKVTAFRAILGEKMFCFETLGEGNNCGYVFSCTVLQAFCDALLTEKEVAFQLDYIDRYGNAYSGTIDPVEYNDLADLRAMAQLLNDSNAWSICPYNYLSDYFYGATME